MNLNSWQTVPWNPLPAKTIGIISVEANDAYLFLWTKNTEHFVLAIEQKKSQDRVADMQLGNIKKTVDKKMNF